LKQGGYFLLHYSTFTDSFPLGSRMLYVARTFLFYQWYQRQTGQLLFGDKDKEKNGNNSCQLIFVSQID